MSKKFHNRPSWKNQYSEHDFRTTEERRVCFKSYKHNKNKGNNKDYTNMVRAHMFEEDIDMGLQVAGPSRSGNKFNKKGRRSGSPVPRPLFKKKLLEAPAGWYRVTLPYGNKYEKQFVQRTLLEKLSPLPLCPVCWKAQGNSVTFYLDDFKTAEKLLELDHGFQMPDGFKLIIKVHPGSPNVEVTQEIKDKMKLAMANRYNAANKALDLTKFHADPLLTDHFCALYKPIILIAAVEIISENIPELEALSLNNNKIQVLSVMGRCAKKLKNLKILHLGENKIRDITMLDSLIGMPLVEIFLDGNPLCDKFRDKERYISEVRTRFPKIIKLDGTDLPPPISFDLEEHTLPTSLQTFLCNADGGPIVRQFLEQYFQLFDSDNRQMLMQAYHENAMFSMTMAYPYGTKDKSANWLNWYATDNRNLFRVNDSDRRMKLLKKGNVSIVSFLKEMPMSNHDIMNFKVDLSVYTPIMMSLTVSGMFKELKSGHKNPPIRSFFRTLIIIPAGSGYCITNEELHMTNATPEQVKAFNSTPLPPPVVIASPTVPAPVVQELPVQNAIDDTTKQQMVQALASQSGMNLEWSIKCLQETDWNFDTAIRVFNEAHKNGGIPAEAFVK